MDLGCREWPDLGWGQNWWNNAIRTHFCGSGDGGGDRAAKETRCGGGRGGERKSEEEAKMAARGGAILQRGKEPGTWV